MLAGMNSVAVVGIVVIAVLLGFLVVRSRRQQLVPQRGFGVAADLGGLADAVHGRIRSVATTAPGRVLVIFTPDADPAEPPAADLDLLVSLDEGDFGYRLLQQWQRADGPIAMVMPPGGRLVRLRSVESLQHLTLRRVDGG